MDLSKDEALQLERRNMLKFYLGQYIRSKRRKRQLEERLEGIQQEMNAPIGGLNYKLMPNNRNGSVGSGAAGITMRLADIEEKIYEEKELLAKTMVNVMEIIEYLDSSSKEREVLEYIYIDGYSIDGVAKYMLYSRMQIYRYFRSGLNKLLGYERVLRKIKEYDEKFCDSI